MIPSDVLSEMATLGLSREQAERVAAMLARVEQATEARSNEAIEARRANDRDRKARQRHEKSREATGQNVKAEDNPDKGSPDVSPQRDINQTPLPNPSKNAAGASLVSILTEDCLTEATALAVIAHRKTKKSPLTPHSASLLRKSLLACGNPDAAASEMLLRGWTAVKPEWLKDKFGQAAPCATGPAEAVKWIDATSPAFQAANAILISQGQSPKRPIRTKGKFDEGSYFDSAIADRALSPHAGAAA